MAHMISNVNGRNEMAYVGEKPWHGLGQELRDGAPIEEWITAAGMDWRIQRAKVRYATAHDQGADEMREWGDYHVLMRSDTKDPLGMVSDRFHIVQPAEVLEFFRDLVDVAGFKLETAGTLLGGRKFWALANINAEDRILGNDLVKGRLLFATACDGSMRSTVKNVAERVVCANTLAIAMGEKTDSIVQVSHKTRFDAKAVKAQLGIAVDSFARFIVDARNLAARRVGPSEAETFIAKLRGFEEVCDDARDDRGFKKIIALFNGEGRGANLPGTRGTAWGLVNAVTEYVDHHYPARTVDNRLNHAWFAQGDAMKSRAMNDAVALLAA